MYSQGVMQNPSGVLSVVLAYFTEPASIISRLGKGALYSPISTYRHQASGRASGESLGGERPRRLAVIIP